MIFRQITHDDLGCASYGALAAATDATVHIHREAGVDYRHEPFTDGWELGVGSVTVRAVLSGDTLFVGDIRPDLAVDKREGARGTGFGSKLAWLADPGTSVLIVGRDDQAGALAAAVGVTNITGYLAGGIDPAAPVAVVCGSRQRAAVAASLLQRCPASLYFVRAICRRTLNLGPHRLVV